MFYFIKYIYIRSIIDCYDFTHYDKGKDLKI